MQSRPSSKAQIAEPNVPGSPPFAGTLCLSMPIKAEKFKIPRSSVVGSEPNWYPSHRESTEKSSIGPGNYLIVCRPNKHCLILVIFSKLEMQHNFKRDPNTKGELAFHWLGCNSIVVTKKPARRKEAGQRAESRAAYCRLPPWSPEFAPAGMTCQATNSAVCSRFPKIVEHTLELRCARSPTSTR